MLIVLCYFDYEYHNQDLLVATHGSMPELKLLMLLKNSDSMIESDTIIEYDYNNPRSARIYSRLFGKFV